MKAARAAGSLFLNALPPIPCAARWLTVVAMLGMILFGTILGRIVPDGFLRQWVARLVDTYADEEERPDDPFQVRNGKRQQKSRKLFEDVCKDHLLAFTVTMLRHVEKVMATLMHLSKFEFTAVSVCDTIEAINKGVTALVELHSTCSLTDPESVWFQAYF